MIDWERVGQVYDGDRALEVLLNGELQLWPYVPAGFIWDAAGRSLAATDHISRGLSMAYDDTTGALSFEWED